MSEVSARERVRHFFAVLAVLALFVFAIRIAFPYGPPGPAFSDETTNPFYLGMSWFESLWRLCLSALLASTGFAVIFTLFALSGGKQQREYL
jgi:hypothetical protein